MSSFFFFLSTDFILLTVFACPRKNIQSINSNTIERQRGHIDDQKMESYLISVMKRNLCLGHSAQKFCLFNHWENRLFACCVAEQRASPHEKSLAVAQLASQRSQMLFGGFPLGTSPTLQTSTNEIFVTAPCEPVWKCAKEKRRCTRNLNVMETVIQDTDTPQVKWTYRFENPASRSLSTSISLLCTQVLSFLPRDQGISQ